MNGTIALRFKDNTAEEDIYDLLDEHRLRGTRVSDWLRRWTVEVPPEKEEYFIEVFRTNELVESVSSSYIKGHKPTKREKDADEEGRDRETASRKSNSGNGPDTPKAAKTTSKKW